MTGHFPRMTCPVRCPTTHVTCKSLKLYSRQSILHAPHRPPIFSIVGAILLFVIVLRYPSPTSHITNDAYAMPLLEMLLQTLHPDLLVDYLSLSLNLHSVVLSLLFFETCLHCRRLSRFLLSSSPLSMESACGSLLPLFLLLLHHHHDVVGTIVLTACTVVDNNPSPFRSSRPP